MTPPKKPAAKKPTAKKPAAKKPTAKKAATETGSRPVVSTRTGQTTAARSPSGAEVHSSARAGADSGTGSGKGSAIEEQAEQLKAGLDRWATLAQGSLAKASSGAYKSDELVADMAELSVLLAQQAANLFQLGLTIAGRLRTDGRF